jgi:hypothetical protein
MTSLAFIFFVTEFHPLMDIAAGEYRRSAMYLHKMMAAEAVDVTQADATRCRGVSLRMLRGWVHGNCGTSVDTIALSRYE